MITPQERRIADKLMKIWKDRYAKSSLLGNKVKVSKNGKDIYVQSPQRTQGISTIVHR